MDPVPLDRLERELLRELSGSAMATRFSSWGEREPALARFSGADELLRFLRRRPSPSEGDRILLALLRCARMEAAAGRVVLIGVLPGLKAISHRVLRGEDERQEVWSALFVSVWEQICTYPLERRPHRVAANLLLDTLRHTLRAMRASRSTEALIAFDFHKARSVWAVSDDPAPDALLERAVEAGAIAPAEAELVFSTRFDGIPLAHVAAAQGEPYNRVKVRRQRAERRLLLWLGYPPVPRRPQRRPPSIARVADAGLPAQTGAQVPVQVRKGGERAA